MNHKLNVSLLDNIDTNEDGDDDEEEEEQA